MIAHKKNGGYVILPERVATNQKHYSESRTPFKATPCDVAGRPTGKESVMVVLRGDLYGLNTTGTGDPVVTRHSYRRKA